MFRNLTKLKDGSPYFNFKSTNVQIIGTNEMYKSTSGIKNGTAYVQKNAPKATAQDNS